MRNGILEKIQTFWNFKAGSLISELTFACEQPNEPQVTMLWIKEVERTKSMDELVTSRSITGQHHFTDFHMLDAIIASALKKVINTQSTLRKKVSVEEQRAQNSDRFSRRRQIAYMIC